MSHLDAKRKFILMIVIVLGVSIFLIHKPQQQVKSPEPKAESFQSIDSTQLNMISVDQVQDDSADVIVQEDLESPMEAISGIVKSIKQESKPSFEKFIVYQDKPSRNRYVMSGFMPSALCITMNDAHREDCHEGRSCIKATYDAECSAEETGWAGVYWLFPANNWGSQKAGHDLTGAIKLAFWAKGQEGGEVLYFKMGGVGKESSFPDSDSAEIGPVVLTKQWKEYNIYLFSKDLSRISGGFAWVAKSKDNEGRVTFYLDDMRYE